MMTTRLLPALLVAAATLIPSCVKTQKPDHSGYEYKYTGTDGKLHYCGEITAGIAQAKGSLTGLPIGAFKVYIQPSDEFRDFPTSAAAEAWIEANRCQITK